MTTVPAHDLLVSRYLQSMLSTEVHAGTKSCLSDSPVCEICRESGLADMSLCNHGSGDCGCQLLNLFHFSVVLEL